MTSLPAAAEVCDKVVGEYWRPSDGPIGIVPLVSNWTSPVVLLLLLAVPALLVSLHSLLTYTAVSARASFLAAMFLKWCAYVMVAIAALFALLVLYDLISPDEVMRAAAREGCVSLKTDLSLAGIIAIAVLLCGGIAYRMNRFERVAEERYRGHVPQ